MQIVKVISTFIFLTPQKIQCLILIYIIGSFLIGDISYSQDTLSLNNKQRELILLNNSLERLSHSFEIRRKFTGNIQVGAGVVLMVYGAAIISSSEGSSSTEAAGIGEAEVDIFIGGVLVFAGGFSAYEGYRQLRDKTEPEELYIEFKDLPEHNQNDIELKIGRGQLRFEGLSNKYRSRRRKEAWRPAAIGIYYIIFSEEFGGRIIGLLVLGLGAKEYLVKSRVEKYFEEYQKEKNVLLSERKEQPIRFYITTIPRNRFTVTVSLTF